MITQYIMTRSLLDLCEAMETNQGAQVGMRWWEQVGTDRTRSRETAAVAEADEYGLEE